MICGVAQSRATPQYVYILLLSVVYWNRAEGVMT